jgi:hypothetical protein
MCYRLSFFHFFVIRASIFVYYIQAKLCKNPLLYQNRHALGHVILTENEPVASLHHRLGSLEDYD